MAGNKAAFFIKMNLRGSHVWSGTAQRVKMHPAESEQLGRKMFQGASFFFAGQSIRPVQATTFKCASEETCPIQLWAQQNQKSAKLILSGLQQAWNSHLNTLHCSLIYNTFKKDYNNSFQRPVQGFVQAYALNFSC